MTPSYHDEWLTIYGGDVRDVLPELASDSVDCIVTSPPYWGLRDYGTASWAGGDAACDHLRPPLGGDGKTSGLKTPRTGDGAFADGKQHPRLQMYGHTCGKCGAVRQDSQIGLERTPEEYVANLVGVFRELRRVLKPSGTCWLNLGDSYSNPDKGGYAKSRVTATDSLQASHLANNFIGAANRQPQSGLKPKDLVGIPWRVAFALQADGWYLRSDIIWSKPNPMPESVTDRPTKAHEYLFLLTRSPRYFYDADAVREDAISAGQVRGGGQKASTNGIHGGRSDGQNLDRLGQLPTAAGRNLRSVWTIATRPYPGAHFAVFPPELPERCIKAGSSERGVCPECGAPWERVVERIGAVKNIDYADEKRSAMQQGGKTSTTLNGVPATGITTGWRPTCDHFPGVISADNPSGFLDRAVILDPFAGSGTTGMVANRLSRRAILIDLNPEYLRQQLTRNAQTPLGLTEGDAA